MLPGVERVMTAVAAELPGNPCDDAIFLARIRDAIDVAIAQRARVITQERLYEPECSPISWLRWDAHLPTGAAMAAVDVGYQLARLPLTKAAMDEGEIGFSHLAHMARAAELLEHHFNEEHYLQKAREQTVTDFRKTVDHAYHRAFPERFAEEEALLRARRWLKISPTEDGSVWLKGWLDAEGASFVRAALEPLARPGGADDDRKRHTRLGDALVELASQGVTAELVVTVPIDTLLAVQGSTAAETEWGALLGSETVRRLLCDSTVRRLVLDAEGVVIDYGRRRRLFSPNSKKAMAARDGHCRFPHCDRPVRWCEGHHKRAFAKGGGTAVNNGVLLCRRHHHLVHEAGWQLIRDGDYLRAIPPRDQWPPPDVAA